MERRNSQVSSGANSVRTREPEVELTSKNETIKRLNEENVTLQHKLERMERILQKRPANSKVLIKSGLGKDEELMKFEMHSPEKELPEVKATLLKQITQANSQFDLLVARCDKLKEILNIFTANIQYNDMLVLKQTEISKLNDLMKKLSETIANTSRTEIELGMKTRELDKKNHDYGVLSRQYQTILKRNEELERQVEELKQNMRILNDVQARNVNLTIAEKNKSLTMAKRMDVLEKNILSMKEPEKLFNAPDSTQKVRNTFNALIKENQDLRKKLKEYKGKIQDRDRELNKLENKSTNLEKKIREATSFTKGKPGASIVSIRTTGQYHKTELMRFGFFPTQQTATFDRDLSRGLIYKLNVLREQFWKLLADIGEYGSSTFAQNTMEQKDEERRLRLEFIADQYLSYRDLAERLNVLNILCVLLWLSYYASNNSTRTRT